MPRRRRSQTAADEETKSKAKRIKTEPPGVPSTQWEWEDDSNAWTAYTDQLSTQITDAMTNGQKHVELQLSSGVKLKVMFERMVQKNKTTGWDRRVRCCIKDEADTDFFSWEWEDEKGAWNPYSGSVAMDLEQARGAGDVTISVSACNRDYTVDVGKMEQINDATKVKRNIRRIKSAAKLPASAVKVELTEAGEASTSSAATTSGAAAKNGSTAKSGKKTSGRAASGRSGRKVKEEPEEEKVKTVVLKGAAPVDAECLEKQGSAHVYSEGKNIYDVMLNQTNVQNNNNKFFIIQLLEDDARKAYSVWFRWGRVGLRGQSNLVACGPDLEDAKNTFCKKFSDKTKNDWSERAKFKKVPGKYDLLQIDYSVKIPPMGAANQQRARLRTRSGAGIQDVAEVSECGDTTTSRRRSARCVDTPPTSKRRSARRDDTAPTSRKSARCVDTAPTCKRSARCNDTAPTSTRRSARLEARPLPSPAGPSPKVTPSTSGTAKKKPANKPSNQSHGSGAGSKTVKYPENDLSSEEEEEEEDEDEWAAGATDWSEFIAYYRARGNFMQSDIESEIPTESEREDWSDTSSTAAESSDAESGSEAGPISEENREFIRRTEAQVKRIQDQMTELNDQMNMMLNTSWVSEGLTDLPPLDPRSRWEYPFVRNSILKPYMYLQREGLASFLDRYDHQDSMTYPEYVHCFLTMIRDPRTATSRPHLLNHFQQVTKDALEHPWKSVLLWSNNVFDKIDRGELSWEDEGDIRMERIRAVLIPQVHS